MITRAFTRLMSSYSFNSWPADIAAALPRIVCGLLLTIDFGSSKFGMPWTPDDRNLALFEVAGWFPEDVAGFGVPFSWSPVLFAWLGAASEAIGGLFLALGFQTRITAFFISCTMLTAIFFQKWGDGTWGMLPAMGFLWVSIYAMILGSGRIGLDHWLLRAFRLRPVVKIALPVLLLIGLSSCSTSQAGITIPANQEFVLGELENSKYRVNLKNKSKRTIEVRAVNKSTGTQTQGFGLAGKGEVQLSISRQEMVLLRNPHNESVLINAKLNKGVEGMRYRPVEKAPTNN